jgi:hypothetical protein
MASLRGMVGVGLKWSAIAAGGLLAVALCALAAGLIVNAHDEDLTHQARALLMPPPNPYKPEDNVYLALLGSDAPAGQSVIRAGEARVDFYNRHIDAVLRDSSPTAFADFQRASETPQRLEFKGDCSFIQPLNTSVWDAATQHREQVEKLLADNRELYERYLALHGMHGYYETTRPSYVPPPFFAWGGSARKVFLAEVALRMRSGAPAEQRQALADLESDLRLWRTVFGGEGALVSKMISAAYLQGDYLLLADLIAEPHTSLPTGEGDGDAVVAVADLNGWDLGSGLAAEFRVTASILKQTDDLVSGRWTPDDDTQRGASGWLRHVNNRLGARFFKVKATENLIAAYTARRILDAADPAAFYKARSERRFATVSMDEACCTFGWWAAWTPRYNPAGKILAAIEEAASPDYPLRAWDVAALERLVRLGYEIRRLRVEAAEIPAFLRMHPEWSTHPADGRPFLWDANTSELRVQTVAKQQPGRRFSIRVWQPAAAASAALARPLPPR